MPPPDEDEALWFDASALAEVPQAGLVNRLRLPVGDRYIERFAVANGMEFAASAAAALPGLPFRPEYNVKDEVTWSGSPQVRFGNYGWRYWPGKDDHVPSRQGYVAIRHGMALPQVLVNFKGVVGAKTPLNVATMALNASSFADTHASPHGRSVFSHFKRESASFAVTRGGGDVVAFCAEGDVAAAQELMVDPVVAVLDGLSESFLVEIREDWLFAYGFYGDVSTTDPEVWAWVFASASRMAEICLVWREAQPRSGDQIAPFDPRSAPFYTSRWVERPSKLDGIFSSSRFKRR